MASVLWVTVCALGLFFVSSVDALTAVYMPTSCGVPTSVWPSVQLESSTGLTYTNNMNCNITFTATSPYLLLAKFRRFELEPQFSGTCNDYVNLHDGGDVSSSTLNSDMLCGSSLTNSTYVTSGQQLTVHFVTDSTAVYLGFNIVITAVNPGPCVSGQLQCNTSGYCMDSSLQCDNYDQCGDASDEANCSDTTSSSGINVVSIVIGVIFGVLAIVLVVAYILYRRHRRNRWRQFTNDHISRHDDDLPDPDPAYPVTHKYFRGIRGHPNLAAGIASPATYDSVLGTGGGEQKEVEVVGAQA